MTCPQCGGRASLVGLPAGIYPAAYRCYAHGEYSFSACGAETDREVAESRALSQRNAAQPPSALPDRVPLCALNRHRQPRGLGYCPGCAMEWDLEDQAARDKAAGRDLTSIADEEAYGQDD